MLANNAASKTNECIGRLTIFSQRILFALIACTSVFAHSITFAWNADFNSNADGTVTDLATGLIWQQSDAQNNGDGIIHAAAKMYCNDLTLAEKSDWRVPTIKELSSIIDLSRKNPAIDLSAFPAAKSSFYWSASKFGSINAWVVYFYHGAINAYNKLELYNVRCVRGGQ